MASAVLPASRFDAISVFTVSLASALLGATPGESKYIALTQTVLGNSYAIATSIFTFKKLLDDADLETHLRFFIFVLLALTIISSLLSLLAFAFQQRVDRSVIFAGFASSAIALVFGLGALCFAFFQGCKHSELDAFTHSEFCEHEDNVVLPVLAGAFTACVLVGWFILAMLDKYGESSAGALPTLCFHGSDSSDIRNPPPSAYSRHCVDEPVRHRYLRGAMTAGGDVAPHSPASAMVTRLSALVKACLLGVYWFLVDGALSHDAFTFEGYDVTSWITGQYAKQGAAIANNGFNLLPW